MQLTEAPLPVELKNDDLEVVEELNYLGSFLGSIISKNNATVKDITNRLQRAKSSFVRVNKAYECPYIGEKKNKIKIYNSNALPALLYGTEC